MTWAAGLLYCWVVVTCYRRYVRSVSIAWGCLSTLSAAHLLRWRSAQILEYMKYAPVLRAALPGICTT